MLFFSYLCAVKLFVLLLTDNHDPLLVVRAEIFADTKYDENVKRKRDGGDGGPRDVNYGYSPYVAVTSILCVKKTFSEENRTRNIYIE